MNPSSTRSNEYRDILNIFKRYEIWSQMVFYCKPYAKATNEKRNAQGSSFNTRDMYGETISKPSFILKEKEKEIFLNGELQMLKKNIGYGE